jgi:hypothetical protein
VARADRRNSRTRDLYLWTRSKSKKAKERRGERRRGSSVPPLPPALRGRMGGEIKVGDQERICRSGVESRMGRAARAQDGDPGEAGGSRRAAAAVASGNGGAVSAEGHTPCDPIRRVSRPTAESWPGGRSSKREVDSATVGISTGPTASKPRTGRGGLGESALTRAYSERAKTTRCVERRSPSGGGCGVATATLS